MAWCCCFRTRDTEDENNTTEPNWLDLPREVTAKILNNLSSVEILMSARYVCPLWWNICKEPFMWRTIRISLGDLRPYDRYGIEKICCHAIDQSRGHLQHIDIRDIASDSLLKYVANSTNQLRRMRLAFCFKISDKGFSEAANKFSMLEELEICCTSLSKDSIEAVARCCPKLTTLKLYTTLNKPSTLIYDDLIHDEDEDDEAFTIGKLMPNLRHLELLGKSLSNAGLLAILDGCNRLESLDLRGCFHVNLGGSLEKRCRQQIKNLTLPFLLWQLFLF